jgi:hypothetical protein
MRRTPLAVSALAAAALAAPTAAQAQIDQYVAPYDVAKYDRSWTLQSNTSQEFRMNLSEMGRGWHVLVPCWGFDIVGPGVDLSAANLSTFGPIPPANIVPGEPLPSSAVQQPDGTWVIPDSAAAVGASERAVGADCRAIGWNFFVPDGKASAAARKQARRTHRPIKLKAVKRRRTGLRRAQPATSPVNVTLGGMQPAANGSLDLVVRVTTGELSGPTTLTTHGRVLLQPKR